VRVNITNAVGTHQVGDTPDLDPDEARRLVHEGYAVVPDPKAKPKNIDEILADVGADKALATQALADELAKGDKARTTLVDALTPIANPTED